MKNGRKNIELNVESALALMQEMYNDIVEQKNTASLILKKMLMFLKEEEQMSVIGPVIKEQQKILADCINKKSTLVKLQHALIRQSGNQDPKQFAGKLQLSDEDRDLLNKMLEEDKDKNEPEDTKYTM